MPVADTTGLDVIVVIGPDLAGNGFPATTVPAGSAPATTAPATTAPTT